MNPEKSKLLLETLKNKGRIKLKNWNDKFLCLDGDDGCLNLMQFNIGDGIEKVEWPWRQICTHANEWEIFE